MSLPLLREANAHFVTDRLLVGGDLDTWSDDLAARQLAELVDAGVTHLVDVRVEWSDEEWVRELVPELDYLHHGVDDAGQSIPGEWFDVGVGWALDAIRSGGVVLTHCHMGINRGPSLGYAVLLAQGRDAVEALDDVRRARDVAFVAYAEDALRWHHAADPGACDRDLARVARWRESNRLDVADVIRLKRSQDPRRA